MEGVLLDLPVISEATIHPAAVFSILENHLRRNQVTRVIGMCTLVLAIPLEMMSALESCLLGRRKSYLLSQSILLSTGLLFGSVQSGIVEITNCAHIKHEDMPEVRFIQYQTIFFFI